jgi:RNA-binding protein YhbY
VDGLLWTHELCLLRLNKAVAKKKGAKLLGQRIASELNAHVAQVIGHTVLLYRPSFPSPLLELKGLAAEKAVASKAKQQER